MDAIESPDGHYWSVSYRWKPTVGENPDPMLKPTVRVLIGVVAAFVASFYTIYFALRWVDPVVLYLLLGLELFRRVVLRHIWVVEAVTDNGGWYQWRVVGFSDARDRKDEVVEMITSGELPVPLPESSSDGFPAEFLAR